MSNRVIHLLFFREHIPIYHGSRVASSTSSSFFLPSKPISFFLSRRKNFHFLLLLLSLPPRATTREVDFSVRASIARGLWMEFSPLIFLLSVIPTFPFPLLNFSPSASPPDSCQYSFLSPPLPVSIFAPKQGKRSRERTHESLPPVFEVGRKELSL